MIFLFRLFQLIIKRDENKKRILIINIFLIFYYENSNERSLISEFLRKKFDEFSYKEISIINDEYVIKLGNIEDYENFTIKVRISRNYF